MPTARHTRRNAAASRALALTMLRIPWYPIVCLLATLGLLWNADLVANISHYMNTGFADQQMRALTETCELTHNDPFDDVFLAQIEEDRKSKPKCKAREALRSQLVNGTLTMLRTRPDERCKFRCLPLKGNAWHDLLKNWTRFEKEVQVDCGVSEVLCIKNGRAAYNVVHYQVEKKELKHVAKDSRKPNVHIMVIDSAAMPMMYRALPKTMAYLKDTLGARFFPFYNKNGKNSLTNAIPLYTGQSIADHQGEPNGVSYPFISEDALRVCDKNSTYVAKLYQDKGYRTMLNEDWAMIGLMKCRDKEKLPIDHTINPYFERRRTLYPQSHILNTIGPEGRYHYHTNLWWKYCHENHLIMFDYLQKFIDTYNDEPLFTMTWFGIMMHDYRPDIYMYDDDFLQFFKNMTSKLDNSHFFLLGDHGNRILWDRAVFLDRLEDFNPALIYIPPKAVKENANAMTQLAENTPQLVSHFDTYATFIDILENGADWTNDTDFAAPPPQNLRALVGSSYLRPLKQPRNCQSLRIPFDSCLCRTLGERQNGTALAVRLGQHMVDRFNGFVAQFAWAPRFCAKLSLNTGFGPFVEEYKPGRFADPIYLVTLKTTPGNALYMPYVQTFANGTIKLLTDLPSRMNAYGAQTLCLREAKHKMPKWLDFYCFCKNLLNDTLEVNKITG